MKTDEKAKIIKPCACCGERSHDHIPDRELNGYVCKECAQYLVNADAALIKAGMTRPKFPPQ